MIIDKIFEEYPTAVDIDLWLKYSRTETAFKLWSPVAEEVVLRLFEKGDGGEAYERLFLEKTDRGVWMKVVQRDLEGTYYTFQIKTEGKWLEETPGIYAKAVGVNGKRAMVIDMAKTDPKSWHNDKGPQIGKPNEAVIYELHVRDMTIHPSSGCANPGKFLGLVEAGTKSPDGLATGLDHIKELGVTHVHLLPSFDHYAIEETKLHEPQYNWGYDPQNYNVPEGSFSTDPYTADVRIREFKEMVKGFHDQGIGVILDVVYNHTGKTENANFNLEFPGYYYRQWEDGEWSDASACGNETASDRAMMRKFIKESVLYWAKEYHLDGFRFDLMGIHDVETMNEIAEEVEKVSPHLFIYGEGWTAGDSPLPLERRALKHHTTKMPMISVFSDEIRDGLRGSVFEAESTGFVSGAHHTEESIKFGVVGAVHHSQVHLPHVNYSDSHWAHEPWQSVSYVSCHDNHTLYDKLRISRKDASDSDIEAMHRLANSVVLTTQGIPFLHAGVELLRTKDGAHNSYNLPDEINQIHWERKVKYKHIFDYYRNLIALRKNHPAFHMPTGEMVRTHLRFINTAPGMVGFVLEGNANGDSWKNILVVYNANINEKSVHIEGLWKVVVQDTQISELGLSELRNSVVIPRISMLIAYQE